MRNKYQQASTDPDLYETTKALVAAAANAAGWAKHLHIKAYIRLAMIAVDGRLHKSFQIANVVVACRGKGIFTKYLTFAENEIINSGEVNYLYVESVLNKHLAAFLRRRDYTERKFSLGPSSFYKRFEESPGEAPNTRHCLLQKDEYGPPEGRTDKVTMETL